MQKLLINLFFLILLLSGCSNQQDPSISIITDDEIQIQMIKSYREGKDAFEKQNYLEAAKKFNEAELLFPQSDWAPKASLMAAYSYFYDDYNNDAIIQLENFIKTYPEHPHISYAYYLLSLSYYNLIIDEKKDIEPLLKSKTLFSYIYENFPETEYAIDAKFKIDLINELLASKEMYLAKYYINKEKWIPAINRLKYILKNYQTTIYVEEALHRLVEIYYKIGLTEESKRYAIMLGHNYPNSAWYKSSYKIFNKDFTTIKNQEKQSTLEKLKSILD